MLVKGEVFKGEWSVGVEPDATVLYDMSLQKNNGSMTDGKPDWVQLDSGLWVLSSDGTNTVVTLGSAIVLADNTPWTIQFWVYKDTTDEEFLWGNAYVGGSFTRFRTRSTDTIIYNDANQNAPFGFVIPATTWTLLTIVCDGSDSNNLEAFLNATSQDVITFADSSQTIKVLGDSAQDVMNFTGRWSPPRIWNYNLTVSQIFAIFQKQRPYFGI